MTPHAFVSEHWAKAFASRVPQHRLERADLAAVGEQVRRAGVAERAWVDPLGQPGGARVALDDLVDPLARECVPAPIDEHALLLAWLDEQRAAALEVVADRGQRADWDRHEPFPGPVGVGAQHGGVEVKVAVLERATRCSNTVCSPSTTITVEAAPCTRLRMRSRLPTTRTDPATPLFFTADGKTTLLAAARRGRMGQLRDRSEAADGGFGSAWVPAREGMVAGGGPRGAVRVFRARAAGVSHLSGQAADPRAGARSAGSSPVQR